MNKVIMKIPLYVEIETERDRSEVSAFVRETVFPEVARYVNTLRPRWTFRNLFKKFDRNATITFLTDTQVIGDSTKN